MVWLVVLITDEECGPRRTEACATASQSVPRRAALSSWHSGESQFDVLGKERQFDGPVGCCRLKHAAVGIDPPLLEAGQGPLASEREIGHRDPGAWSRPARYPSELCVGSELEVSVAPARLNAAAGKPQASNDPDDTAGGCAAPRTTGIARSLPIPQPSTEHSAEQCAEKVTDHRPSVALAVEQER
jgi:hypothetical protein